MKHLSLVVPAYNEAANIEATVALLLDVCGSTVQEFEILIVDDCSTDSTSEVVARTFGDRPEVRLIRNLTNLGLGGAFRAGVEHAHLPQCLMVPGDNAYDRHALVALLSRMGQADVVTTYTANAWVRPWPRRVLSRAFTVVMNVISGERLKYYNGISIFPTTLLRTISFGNSFAYSAEILLQMIKLHGCSIIEVPVHITERAAGSSKALHPRNILRVVYRVFSLTVMLRLPRMAAATRTRAG